ncbi:restriction endonuclease subunit S [Archangium gephyra]|uniref:restriction endonuclease subunit S n=1 Tax=Archangium gephyra TaxID=48 RepID=UPI003B78EAAB
MATEQLFNVPEHWDTLTLGEACTRGGGDVQTGPFGSQLHASDYVPHGIPSIMPQNIGDNRIITEGIARITLADAERLSRYRVKQGDIIYSRRGDVERRALVRAEEDGWLCGTGCLRVRFGSGPINPKYATYYLGHPAAREWIVRHAVGATMPNLNTSILSSLPFVIPPRAEQEQIAEVLGSFDDKIDLNRRMNQTLEAMAQALFRSWFVDFDPVRAKAEGRQPEGMDAATAALFPSRLADANGTQLPEGWSRSRLGQEVGRCGGMIQTGPFGSQLHASDYVSHGVPVVMPKDISLRHVSTTDIARVRHEDAQRLARHQLCEGDLVYSRRGDVERHALVGIREQGWLCGTGCLLVRLGPKWPSPIYVSLALSQPKAKAWISQHAIGATMPNLNTGILANVPLLVPPDEVLVTFSGIVSALEAQIVQNQRQSETLEQLRNLLLPKLLSGEIRVREAETQLAASA